MPVGPIVLDSTTADEAIFTTFGVKMEASGGTPNSETWHYTLYLCSDRNNCKRRYLLL